MKNNLLRGTILILLLFSASHLFAQDTDPDRAPAKEKQNVSRDLLMDWNPPQIKASCSATCASNSVQCTGDTCSATDNVGVTCTSTLSCGWGCTIVSKQTISCDNGGGGGPTPDNKNQ